MMLKNRIKHFVGQYPSLFFRFYRMFGPANNQKLLYGHDTEIVIEAFPRSANTFAVITFEQAQSRQVKIAHHLHVEAQLVQAAAENIPAVALIRNPEDSFRSLLVKHPETPVGWIINRYIQFYTAVNNLGTKCLVVKYEDVIHDMSAVVELINARFGCDFDVPVHNDAMVKNAFNKIESISRNMNQGKESQVARPSEERKKMAQSIDFSAYKKEIRRANDLYESIKASL